MSSWLVIGSRGQLGLDLLSALGDRGWGIDREEVDITDRLQVKDVIQALDPDVVVNCAAYTAVDAAETDEAAAEAVNGIGAANIAAACERRRLIHISTDYVFDGRATSPYPEDALPAPANAYGRTKLHGEQAVLRLLPERGFVVRTAWLYGAGGDNFVKAMLQFERTRDTVSVVDDQLGQPTWTRDLACQIVALGDSVAPAGIYHGTNSGRTSWFGLARQIFELIGADPDRVQPTTTDHFPRPAARPAFSVLGHDGWIRVGLSPMRAWDQALRAALPEVLDSLISSNAPLRH